MRRVSVPLLLLLVLLAPALPSASAGYWNGGYFWQWDGGEEGERLAAFVPFDRDRCDPVARAGVISLSAKRFNADGTEAFDEWSFVEEGFLLKRYMHIENHKDPVKNQSVPIITTYTLDPPIPLVKPDAKVGDRSWRFESMVNISVGSLAGTPQTSTKAIHYSVVAVRNETVTVDNKTHKGILFHALSMEQTDRNSFSYVWLPDARMWSSRTGRLFPIEPASMTLTRFQADNPPCLDYDRTPRTPWVGEKAVFTDYGSHDPEGGPVAPLWWDFGDGAAPVQGNRVEHVFHAPGKYVLKVWSFDGNGNRADLDLSAYPITVSPPPAIEMTLGGSVNGSYRAEDVLTFSLGGADAGLFKEFKWEFGDGESATESAVTHEYRSAGTYTVTGTFTTTDGRTRTLERYLSVGPPGPKVVTLRITAPKEDAAVGPGDPIRIEGSGFARLRLLLDGKELMESRYPYRDLAFPWGVTPGPHTVKVEALRGSEVVASASRSVTVPGVVPGGSTPTAPTPGGSIPSGTTPDGAPPGTGGPGDPGTATAVTSDKSPETQGNRPWAIVPAPDPILVLAAAALGVAIAARGRGRTR